MPFSGLLRSLLLLSLLFHRTETTADVRTDEQTDERTITWQPKFFSFMGLPDFIRYGAPLAVRKEIIGSLSKLRRQRQRERHQTKGLINRTIALHVRLKSWYIS